MKEKAMKALKLVMMLLIILLFINVGNKEVEAAPKKTKITKVTVRKNWKQAVVNWKKIKQVNGYRVDQYTGGKWKVKKTIAKKRAKKVTIRGTYKQGNTYKFRIKTYVKKNGKRVWSKYSKTFSYKVPVTEMNVSGVRVEKTSAGNKITFHTNGADRYDVYRDGKKVGTIKRGNFIDQTVGNHRYTVVALSTGKKKWYPAVYKTEKRWVVTKKAWTETKIRDVYEERPVVICNQCGEDISDNETSHIYQHIINGEGSNWHVEIRNIKIGIKEEKINYPEQGYWEKKKVLIKKGYWK